MASCGFCCGIGLDKCCNTPNCQSMAGKIMNAGSVLLKTIVSSTNFDRWGNVFKKYPPSDDPSLN